MADNGAKKVIDFGDYIGGEEALQASTRALRVLKRDINDLSKTVGDDSGRIAAGFASIKASFAELESKRLKLSIVSAEDRKLLADYIRQVGELKVARAGYDAAQQAQKQLQQGLTEATRNFNSELAKQKQALRDAAAAGDVEAQRKAAAAIRETTLANTQLSKAVRGANSELTAAKGSYNALVLENNKLLASLHALEGGTAANSLEAKKLQEQIFLNTQVLKDFDAATNRNFRSVGDYKSGFAGLVAELAKARAAQAGLSEGTAMYAQNQQRIVGFQTAAQKSAAQMGLSYEQAEAKINGVAGAVQPFVNDLLRLEKEQREVAKTAGEESVQYQKLGFQIQSTKSKIDDVATATANAGQQQQGLVEQLGFTREGLAQYATQLAVGAIGLQALVSAVQGAFAANVEYSRNLAEVRKTTGLTADEAERLAQSLKQLNTPTSLAGLLKIASVGGQLGIAKNDLLAFTKAIDTAVQALGNDFQGGAEEIATTLGKIGSVYRRELGADAAQNILAIGSAVNQLGAEGSATAPFLTDVALRVGALSASTGVGLKNVLAYAAVLQETGSTSEVAGTALNRFFSTLTTKTKEAYEIARIANPALTLKEFTRLVNTDFNQAIQVFLRGLKEGGKTTTEQARLLATLKLQSGEAKNAIVTLAQNTELFADRQKTANDQLRDATSLAAEAAINSDTLAGSVDKFKNQISNFVTSGGGAGFLKFLVDFERDAYKLTLLPFQKIGDGITFIREKLGLSQKPLENMAAKQAEVVTASYKQIAAQEALLKSYTELGAVTERSGLQENEYSKLRERVQKEFSTTDLSLIAERIAARKAETEANKDELKRNLDLFTQAEDEAARRVAKLRDAFATTPKNAAGIASTAAGQQLAERLAGAERTLAQAQRQRAQYAEALAKFQTKANQANKDGLAPAAELGQAEVDLGRTRRENQKNRIDDLKAAQADNQKLIAEAREYIAAQSKLFQDGRLSVEAYREAIGGADDYLDQKLRDGLSISKQLIRAGANEAIEEAKKGELQQLKNQKLSAAERLDIEGQYSAKVVGIVKQRNRDIAKAEEDYLKTRAVDPLEIKLPEIDFDKYFEDLGRRSLLTYERRAKDIRAVQDAADAESLQALANGEINENKYNERRLANKLKADQEELAAAKLFHKSTLDAQKKVNEDIIEQQQLLKAKRLAIIESVGSVTQELETNFFAIRGNFIDADIQRTQEAYDNEVKAAGDNADLKAQIQKKYDKELKRLNYERAKSERDQAVITIAINTAVAVAKSIASSPTTFGLPFSAINLVLGLAQEAVVLSKPLPAYFKGRKSGPAEWAEVAERGPELVQRKATGRFEYISQRSIVPLQKDDLVHTAAETNALLAKVGLTHQSAQQPQQMARAFGASADGARQAREAREVRGYDKLAENLAANTAALKQIQAPKITVHKGSEADIETSNMLLRRLKERQFK